jgi:methylenetetrahydrofolate--tRNA-(uracil-5-)-methyltransferase
MTEATVVVGTVTVVGAGLAGCEAAWQLARNGVAVRLVEMKPLKKTPAHVSDEFCELVCSNSLRSGELTNAVGLLKEEMRRLGSLVMECADATKIPAGGALAVDRSAFSKMATDRLRAHPLVTVEMREVTEIPDGRVILATGPLTSDALAEKIGALIGSGEFLSFYDAAAPIVTFGSVDMDSAYFASRYGKGTADYINCPMSKEEYLSFRTSLASAEEAHVHGFEDSGVFEGCMPIEVMARRGEDTMRYGPLKPVGLTDPKTQKTPYAVVQLRKDNAAGTLYNIVGFQTHLKFPEQKRVFSMIPALKNAEFVRYGVMHRNTYLDSPRLLDRYYRLRSMPRVGFAGQMTGVEGYVESAASGLLAGLETSRELKGLPPLDFPAETAIGALALYVSGGSVGGFQPMNVNFGIISPLSYKVKGKRNKNLDISQRSLESIDAIRSEGERFER